MESRRISIGAFDGSTLTFEPFTFLIANLMSRLKYLLKHTIVRIRVDSIPQLTSYFSLSIVRVNALLCVGVNGNVFLNIRSLQYNDIS